MNILFVLYGDFSSNSANPLSLYARELRALGHSCAIAVPSNLEETIGLYENPAFSPVLYADALAAPDSVFPDRRPADVIHACTPREVVRQFVASYMAWRPTPLVIYLEDNESWISARALGLDGAALARYTEKEIAGRLPAAYAHPFRFDSFIGLADAVAVIQDKLKVKVPPWVPCETVMIGVDVDFFSPRPADPSLRAKYGVAQGEKVIAYHGGLNEFVRPAIQTLCRAVGLLNRQGVKCRLLRTGPFALDFLDQLPPETRSAINDLGLLPKQELPDLLALADAFVQPGKVDPFEDLRLPGKVPEFLAMGRPVVLPDVNIAHLFRDGVDAILLRTGSAEEIADKCASLFSDPHRANLIGRNGRLLAEKHFDVRIQARLLETIYKSARDGFNAGIAASVWRTDNAFDPVNLLLARKLRSLASLPADKVGVTAVAVLKEHAKYIESMHRRVQGLQTGMAERDEQVAELNRAFAELHESLSWRLTAPIRYVEKQVLRARIIRRALPKARAKYGGYRGLLRNLWRVYRDEGLNGIKHRIAERNRNDYTEWVRLYDTLTDDDRKKIALRIARLPQSPIISVLMPVYNAPLGMLEEAIQSVQRQLYPNWELCIADDASADNAVRELLQRFAARDPRIKLVLRERNGHISAASNSALALASGEYLALLDHDDVLREHALFCAALAISDHPDAGLIYSDEDKIDQSGKRYDPYFKCDWNPGLFLSQNMVCHLGVYRADLVRKVGGFREGYEGAQDYDLALRCSEQLAPEQIVHIPRVLYHWRSHSGSTARAGSEKRYAQSAGERALNDHFARVGVPARAELLESGMYRAHYEIPEPAPLVSLIIPTRNGLKLIRQCVESILAKTTYKNYEILVVDNNSDDPRTLEYFGSLSENRRVRILRDERTFNFSALNNAAVRQARGEYLGLVNNDIEVITPRWLDEMMGLAIQPGAGAVGARLWYPNDTLQHGGCILGIGGVAGHPNRRLPKGQFGYFSRAQLIQDLSVVTAACMVIKKEIYLKVGGLDETNLKVAFNDVDFCLRVRAAGYRNVWTPYAELYHHESASRGIEDTAEKRLRFQEEVLFMKRRWGDTLLNDPAYSPNLTLEREDYSFAWPPRLKPLAD